MEASVKNNRSLRICRQRQVETFHAAMNSLRKQEIDTDVTIICGDKEFKVHKIIVTASSAYFRKMLNSDFEESKTNRVQMLTISDWVMDIILDFLYLSTPPTTTTSDSLEKFTEVFKAAHLLGIDPLSNYCWMIMRSQITLKNYLELWNMNTLYGSTEDVEDILKFAVRCISEIVDDDSFLDLNATQLKLLLCKLKSCKTFLEDRFLTDAILKWIRKKEKRVKYLCSLFDCLDLNMLTNDCLANLIHNEPLFQKDTKVLLKVLQFILPNPAKIWFRNPSPVDSLTHTPLPLLKVYFFGYYYRKDETKNTYNKVGAMQIVDIKNQTKEKLVHLPFPVTKGMACVRRHDTIFFIGGESTNRWEMVGDVSKPSFSTYLKTNGNGRVWPSNPTNVFLVYDIKSNSLSIKCSLIHPVSFAQACFANGNILYVVGGTANANGNQPLIQYYDETHHEWHAIEIPESDVTILSSVNLNGTLYLVCATIQRKFCLYSVERDNVCIFHAEIPFPYELRPNLITTYDNELCCFIFEEGTSVCILYNPLKKIWYSVYVPFQLEDFAPVLQLLSFEPNRRMLIFVDYDNAFLFSPKTPKFNPALPKIIMDLGKRETITFSDLNKESFEQSHAIMIL